MARRDRELRHEQRQAERRHGPDTSRTVHTFADGWTIRRPVTSQDERREGTLMHNCLREMSMQWAYGIDAAGYSLRDTGNFPHLTLCHYPRGFPLLHIAPGTTYAFGRANTLPKHAYLEYVHDWHDALPYSASLHYTAEQLDQLAAHGG